MMTLIAELVRTGLGLIPHAAAQSTGVTIQNPLGCDDFECVATEIINGLFTVAAPILVIVVLVGGFQMMTAGGDSEKFSRGKKTLLYGAIGFVVIILSASVQFIIRDAFR